ncbi:MAG: FecR domain-containing protein [Prolixibacteraceae bacterium]|nr:FecR domain-containing protein [Prolixibacteraceae bacterium]
MENNKIEERFVSYLAGESEVNDEKGFPATDEFRELEKTWDLAGIAYSYHNSDSDIAWTKLNESLSTDAKIVPLKRFNLLRYAAIFVVLIALGSITFLLTDRPAKIIEKLTALAAPEMKTVQTVANPSEFTTVVLPDGTTVKMNASSTLQFPAQFADGSRKVKLSGEAYFEVVHDSANPFIVELSNMEVEDLGTSFMISAYPGNARVKVNVTSGSVRLHEKNQNGEALLIAGWSGKFRSETGKIEVANSLDPNYLSWITREVSFHHTPLSAVFDELENVYHVRITFTDPGIGDLPYTANFEKFDLGEIVKIIAKTHHLTAQKEGDGFVFSRK